MTWIYSNGTLAKGFAPEYQMDATAYIAGAEFGSLPTEGIPTGIKAFVVDWADLDSATQSTIGGEVLIFNDVAKKWQPQQ